MPAIELSDNISTVKVFQEIMLPGSLFSWKIVKSLSSPLTIRTQRFILPPAQKKFVQMSQLLFECIPKGLGQSQYSLPSKS